MGRVIALLTIAALTACDVVTSRYATLAEARAGRLIERGWLPDILPESATDFKVSNNLDVNTSEGNFRFSPTDIARFRQQTKVGAPDIAPFAGWTRERSERRRSGFAETTYQSGGSTWVFFCKFEEGRCEYAMWGSRG
jgi:hypothetical protein